MEKRMIIAVVLSIVVLVTWQKFSPQKTTTRGYTDSASNVQGSVLSQKDFGFEQEGDSSSAEAVPGRQVQTINSKPQEEQEQIILTEKHTLVFSNIGGSLKEISLSEYIEDGKEEMIFSEKNPEKYIFSMDSALIPNLGKRKFSMEKEENHLEYSLIEPDWLEIRKRYTIHKSLDYMTLEVFVKNISSRTITFSYQMQGPSNLKTQDKLAGRNFVEANTLLDGKIWKAKGVKGGIEERTGEIAWTAVKNRYFALILKPFVAQQAVVFKQDVKKNLYTMIRTQKHTLLPGGEIKEEYILYAGPLKEKELAEIGYDLEQVVDFGFLGVISKKLLAILRFFHKGVQNWGVAIILLTLLINLILFPLTAKSFKSMQEMKKVQPHIQKLKELHKDNPQKLNKETMELYKKYNVNPLGGCLPMLLQMPIFISLYQGLMRSIELKGANFLWIKNLAKPDAVPLPMTLPLIGASINILPLLMVGVMVLQQKVTQGKSVGPVTTEQASQQKMMVMMPLVFGFLFYKMPSGLVLYWLTNTILMTIEHGLIGRKINKS